ncbi:hypothetical protein EDC96DRAFT_449829, partial [Choanephora cucurbitarum]
VDIMNLYVKNLDPQITSLELNRAFSKFGRIISARVMSNPATHLSKGYGFVSYGKSEEAAAALQAMNGAMLGSRPLAVAYHEPRKGRNNNNTNNNNNNTTNSNNNNYHHTHHHSNNTSNNSTPIMIPSNAPINGLGIDNVDELGINMNLRDLSIGQKPISDATHHINSSPGSGTSTGRSLVSLASGLSIQQGPPSQQQTSAINFGHNGRPTLRRRGSLESVMTESSANIQRIKLEDAVRQCGYQGKIASDIVDMLLTLKRKERSLCLFNRDFLRDKVELALEALNTCNESDTSLTQENLMNNQKAAEATTNTNTTSASANAGATNTTTNTTTMSATSTAPVVQTATGQQPRSKEIEQLLLSIEGKPIHEKKQLLGDKLFPLVKATGTRQAPKVTIYLLDTVDLHDLANIMYDTPSLKARVEEAFGSLQQQQ